MEESANTQTTTRTTVIRVLHWTMILLSGVATIVLLSNPSISVKILLSLLLILYTLTVITNSTIGKILFQLTSQKESMLKNLHPWSVEAIDQSEKRKDRGEKINESSHPQNQTRNESLNISASRSLSQSLDIKSMSKSILNYMNTSGLSQSRLSRLRSSAKPIQPKGFDLEETFSDQKNDPLNTSTTKSSGIVLVDTETYLSNRTRRFKEEMEKEFEKVLRGRLKKDRRFMYRRYESILGIIVKVLKSLINTHIFAKTKLKQISQEYLDISLIDCDLKAQYEPEKIKHSFQNKMPFNVFLYRLIMLKNHHLKFADSGIILKTDKRWTVAGPRLNEYLTSMITSSEQLGVDCSLVESQFRTNTIEFVERYIECTEMIEGFLKAESKLKGEQGTNKLQVRAKYRTYVLYLMVRELNSYLGESSKIKFNDNKVFRYPKAEKIQLQIVKRAGSEDPMIHFDVFQREEGALKDRLTCEPGEKNYLSVIFFVLYQLSREADVISQNPKIADLVSDVIN